MLAQFGGVLLGTNQQKKDEARNRRCVSSKPAQSGANPSQKGGGVTPPTFFDGFGGQSDRTDLAPKIYDFRLRPARWLQMLRTISISVAFGRVGRKIVPYGAASDE